NKHIKLKIALAVSLTLPFIILITLFFYDKGNIVHSEQFNTVISQSSPFILSPPNSVFGAYTIG
ncbi:hypothetical protein OAO18_08750, partial [Francisellaceae bacterium]|nr:hypothetical protein [Francisellaceae bacterium]